MTDISIIRHQEIFDPTGFTMPIHIVGAGATGSRVWLALVELGLTNIRVYDFDTVEGHNLANQIYLHEDIGKLKVQALHDYYTRKTGAEPPREMEFINIRIDRLNSRYIQEGITFLLTDTMASRKEIYNAITDYDGNCGMIETRMASSYGDIYTVNLFDFKARAAWLKTLSDDEETEVSTCGSSISVGPTASIIANMAVWQMINLIKDRSAVEYHIKLFLKPLIVNMETRHAA